MTGIFGCVCDFSSYIKYGWFFFNLLVIWKSVHKLCDTFPFKTGAKFPNLRVSCLFPCAACERISSICF